ncbi:helix-turn-helix domain-containing protein [Halobellus captivus]|uniref:helix-turn-helix domain-containing protein n=1 Tax=Halobellus captivus TaxID=2592614 RepID=UPI0011A0B6D2|nr:bacterio-opsin activator domain-containing protein [Halobellus captivus]
MSEKVPRERDSSIHEVEFTLRDSKYPFVGVSESENCTVELVEMLSRGDGRYSEFFNVIDADPQRVDALSTAHGSVDTTLLCDYESGGLFEFTVSGDCPAYHLAELGALPRTVRGENGEGRIVVEIPPQYDSRAIIDAFLAKHPNAELTGKREKDGVTPMFSRSTYQQLLTSELTERQREVIQTAFEAGYYDWPRETTGEDVAAELGITSATFSEHIHAAERKLLSALFAELP